MTGAGRVVEHSPQVHIVYYAQMAFSERTQVLLSPEQRARVEREARHRGISVGAFIREAVDDHTTPRRRPRAEALEGLLRLRAPVADWHRMKEEILRGATR